MFYGPVTPFTKRFLVVGLVLAALVASALGALALSALGLAWYVAPVAVAAFAFGRLGRL